MNSMDGHTQVGNGYTPRHALVIDADQAYRFHMDNTYLPYVIEVGGAERWMERPIKVTLSTPTPTGSVATAFYLDEAEARKLAALLAERAALSSPPADDVRESLAEMAWSDYQVERGYSTWATVPDVGADFMAGFERGYEVRPHGTVTSRADSGSISEPLGRLVEVLAAEVKSMRSSGDAFTDETWMNGAMHVIVRLRSEAAAGEARS